MAWGAVITGDVVASTALERSAYKKLLKELESLLAPHAHEIFRGDSLQVFVKDPAEALGLLLQLRLAAIKARGESGPQTDLRAAIGLGAVKLPVKVLGTATDEAFVLSGRALDALKASQRLQIATAASGPAATGLQVVAEFADFLLQRLTLKQASVLAELLPTRTQKEVAKRLRKSQATVHKHLQAAGWPQLEKLLAHYTQLVHGLIL